MLDLESSPPQRTSLSLDNNERVWPDKGKGRSGMEQVSYALEEQLSSRGGGNKSTLARVLESTMPPTSTCPDVIDYCSN